jgi:hypothetical protein
MPHPWLGKGEWLCFNCLCYLASVKDVVSGELTENSVYVCVCVCVCARARGLNVV